MTTPRRPSRAFTLVELLVVIAIVALLSAFVIFGSQWMEPELPFGSFRLISGLVLLPVFFCAWLVVIEVHGVQSFAASLDGDAEEAG